MTSGRRALRRLTYGFAAAILTVAVTTSGVHADPASDAVAQLDELSRQAVQTRQAVTDAQRDVDATLAAQAAAEDHHRAELRALEEANSALQPYQEAVNRVAAMTYMGGRTDQLAAVLSAASPQQLIDELSLQRAMAAEMADQMSAFRAARERAAAAARTSEKSAAAARGAAEQAVKVQTELQVKWTDLQQQILAAEAQYAALTPPQQAAVDNAAAVLPPPPAAATPVDPPLAAVPAQPPGLPESLPVGVANEAGLQPNTILAARAVSARFPQIAAIDGVRPDSKPWHPSGLAIDIMIPNSASPEGIALGDEILAFAMSNAARFGLQDVIWRGTYYTPAGPQASGYGHYDHVHITTTPG